MADHKKFADKRTTLYWVDPHKLKIKPGLNGRGDLTTPDNIEHIRFLADSMHEHGFREDAPLEVAQIDGEMVITAGHCRHAAVLLAIAEGKPIEVVPYVPERQGTDEVDRIAYQRMSNSGKPLTPLEEGYNVKRLMGLGLDVPTIAKRTGRSGTYIDTLLALQAAPVDVRDMVRAGEVSAKGAVDTIRREGETAGAEVLRESVDAAHAAGKRKASPKDIQARLEAKDTERRFRMAYKPKTGLLAVRIGNVEFKFGPSIWLDIADKIADEARKIIGEGERGEGTADAALTEGVAA